MSFLLFSLVSFYSSLKAQLGWPIGRWEMRPGTGSAVLLQATIKRMQMCSEYEASESVGTYCMEAFKALSGRGRAQCGEGRERTPSWERTCLDSQVIAEMQRQGRGRSERPVPGSESVVVGEGEGLQCTCTGWPDSEYALTKTHGGLGINVRFEVESSLRITPCSGHHAHESQSFRTSALSPLS